MRYGLIWYILLGFPLWMIDCFSIIDYFSGDLSAIIDNLFIDGMFFCFIGCFFQERFYWEWIALKGNGVKIYEAPKSKIPFVKGELWKQEAKDDGFQIPIQDRNKPYVVESEEKEFLSFNLKGLNPNT